MRHFSVFEFRFSQENSEAGLTAPACTPREYLWEGQIYIASKSCSIIMHVRRLSITRAKLKAIRADLIFGGDASIEINGNCRIATAYDCILKCHLLQAHCVTFSSI